MSDSYINRYNPDVLSCIANLSNDEVFTSPEIANQMLDLLPQELFSDPNAKFLDPACKSGVFLREIAKRLIKGLEEKIPDLQERIDHIFHNQLYGIAITELTSLLSRRSLYCSKYPNSKYSVSRFDDVQGNVRFKNIRHRWKDGKCVFCGASQSEYDRGDGLESYAYEFIHTTNPEEIWNMKFDVIIGNPPYQLSTGGGSAQAIPLYNHFVEQAKKLNPRYLSMIIPARWFAGGMNLRDFRATMLNDKRIRILVDFPNAKDCFPQSSIGGGVCYFLWDRDHRGDCKITNSIADSRNTLVRRLDEYDVFIRYNEAVGIVRKITKNEKVRFSSLCSALSPFGVASNERGNSIPQKDSLTLYSSKGIGYISPESITTGNSWINEYKVMISKTGAEHAGEPDKNGQFKVLSKIAVLKPKEVCTFSYFLAGPFRTKQEAENVVTYLQTRFARFLVLQAVSSINLTRDKFNFLPIQDFSIAWTDEMLYNKYGLNEEEVAFIESMIKPME